MTIINKSSADEFRDRLLPITITHAFETVPLYRRLYERIPSIERVGLSRLDELPIVSKEIIVKAGEEALSSTTKTDYIQYTSGTTGRPMLVHRSYAEATAIEQFFTKLIMDEPEQEIRPIVLSLSSFIHGTPTSVPGKAFVLSACIMDDETAKTAMQLLLERYNLPGFEDHISTLSGPVAQVVLFTQYLHEAGVDTAACHLQQLSVYGRYLSEYYWRFLREAWACPIVDRYSLTEVFGGATDYEKAGAVFDVHVIPQVVDAEGKCLTDEGEGRLILTSLYPFMQRQPMIRYDTGDIFALKRDEKGLSRFKFRGRRSISIAYPENPRQYSLTGTDSLDAISVMEPGLPGSYLLMGADILDVLDGLPIVRRSSHAGELSIKNRIIYGMPVFSVDLDNSVAGLTQISLKVELVCPVSHVRPYADEVSQQIRRSVLALSPKLAAAENNGTIRFDVQALDPK